MSTASELNHSTNRSYFCAGWRCLASRGLPHVVLCSDGDARRLAWALCLVQAADFFSCGVMHARLELHVADECTPRRRRAEGPQSAFGFDRWGFCAASINWRLASARTAASSLKNGPRGVCRPPDAVPPHGGESRGTEGGGCARLPECRGTPLRAAETGRDAARR